jgi:hypothetical protein
MKPIQLSASLALASLFFLGTAPLPAYAANQVPIGARAIAMGGAFSSIADDATATFWNPAGLPQIDHQELYATHADLFGTGIKDNFFAFVLPVHRNHTLAAGWYHSGFEDQELDFGENQFELSYGFRPISQLSFGLTGKSRIWTEPTCARAAGWASIWGCSVARSEISGWPLSSRTYLTRISITPATCPAWRTPET